SQTEYASWRANFGQPAGGVGTSLSDAVPEPSSMSLFVIAMGGAMVRLRSTSIRRQASWLRLLNIRDPNGSPEAALRRLPIQHAGLARCPPRPAAQRDRGKMAAEGDREFQRVLQRLHAAKHRNAIKIAFRVRVGEV